MDTLQVWLRTSLYDLFEINLASPLWKRRGRMLITLTCLLMVISWVNFIPNILSSLQTLFSAPLANAAYWGFTLIQLGVMLIPIYLARFGRVRLGAALLLGMLIFGLIKYAIARGYPDMNMLTMAVLMLMIPLAGALMGAEFSVVMAGILMVIETTLTNTLDPTFPHTHLQAMYWINGAMGVIMAGIFLNYEVVVKSAERQAAQCELAHKAQRQMDEEWIEHVVAHYARTLLREPASVIRENIKLLKADESLLPPHLGEAVFHISATLKELDQSWDYVTAISPSGVPLIEAEIMPFPTPMIVSTFKREFAMYHQRGDSPTVTDNLAADTPPHVMVAPALMRRVLAEVVEYLGAPAEVDTIHISLSAAAPHHAQIRIAPADERISKPQLWLRLAQWFNPPVPVVRLPASQVLQPVMSWVHLMGCEMHIEGEDTRPSAVVIRMPVRA